MGRRGIKSKIEKWEKREKKRREEEGGISKHLANILVLSKLAWLCKLILKK